MKAKLLQAATSMPVKMERWTTRVYDAQTGDYCGTAGCIAGNIILINGGILEGKGIPYGEAVMPNGRRVIIPEEARDLAGMPNNRLFYIHKWPTHLLGVNPENPTQEEVQKAVADYIKTDGWTN